MNGGRGADNRRLSGGERCRGGEAGRERERERAGTEIYNRQMARAMDTLECGCNASPATQIL